MDNIKRTELKFYTEYWFGNPPLVKESTDGPWLLPDGTVYDPKTYVPDNTPPNIEWDIETGECKDLGVHSYRSTRYIIPVNESPSVFEKLIKKVRNFLQLLSYKIKRQKICKPFLKE